MNLGSSDLKVSQSNGSQKERQKQVTARNRREKEYRSRLELKQADKKAVLRSKAKQPYNRTFMETPDDLVVENTTFVGRVERKNYHKKAQRQVKFVSWVFGLFPALVTLLLAVSVLGGGDIIDSWASSASSSPTIQEGKTTQTESASPTITTSSSDKSDDLDGDWEKDVIYLDDASTDTEED